MKINTQIKLSTLWIIVALNMAFADILSLYVPGFLEELTAFAGDTPITTIMMAAAIILQIPILMIFFARILKPKLNRMVNIIAAIFTIVFVVGGGTAMPHYIVIASVEVLCLLLIIWNAWKWESSEV